MPRKTEKDYTGELIQLIGLVTLGAGIGLELAFRGSIWFTVITAGSIIFTVGTKLKGR